MRALPPQRLEIICTLTELTQEELGVILGESTATISRWINGISPISESAIEKIERIWGAGNMRTKNMGEGVEINSPFLTIEEAAAFCNMGRRAFLDAANAAGVPYRLTSDRKQKGRRIYDVPDLEAFMRAEKVQQ